MMRKEAAFDTQYLTHEVVTAPFKLRTYWLLRKILLGFIFISIANLFFSYLFYTPKMYRIMRDNREMVTKYHILQDKIRSTQLQLDEIRHRDNFVYRSLFSTDTLSIEGIYTPYPASKYEAWAHDKYATLMTDTWMQLDAYARQLYQESVSLDELQILSRNKENLSMAIPAVWPIDRARLRGQIGAFNPRRLHPILHVIRPHNGADLPGRQGDPIFATGDAVVAFTDAAGNNRGYGKQILLDHEFGYKTRYGHLSRVLVKEGDKVVRGQQIAEMGSTGMSEAPHLHYEVIFQGHPVNPINYFDKNMTPQEYERLMENIRETNLERLD
ncbi:MAG: M23 family metallopeptidase [Alistipes sp.]